MPEPQASCFMVPPDPHQAPEATEPTAVRALLKEWEAGESRALDELMPLVTHELRRLAQSFFNHEDPDHTLQPTALVNEIYLHFRSRRSVQWQDRAQFFGYAARAMKRLLIDHARVRKAEKRGGGVAAVELDEARLEVLAPRSVELIALDDALRRLAELDSRQATIVEMRFFAGLSLDEIAAMLGVNERTVRRDWSTAQLWLRRAMASES